MRTPSTRLLSYSFKTFSVIPKKDIGAEMSRLMFPMDGWGEGRPVPNNRLSGNGKPARGKGKYLQMSIDKNQPFKVTLPMVILE